MSVEVTWKDKGATISSLNAVKEFPVLTNHDIDGAIADGTLDTKVGEQGLVGVVEEVVVVGRFLLKWVKWGLKLLFWWVDQKSFFAWLFHEGWKEVKNRG